MLEESTYFEELLEGVDKLQITLKGSKNILNERFYSVHLFKGARIIIFSNSFIRVKSKVFVKLLEKQLKVCSDDNDDVARILWKLL